MENFYITKIHIDKVRHLEDVPIELSEIQCKHLIVTGKNGSGKTSLLESLCSCVVSAQMWTTYHDDGTETDVIYTRPNQNGTRIYFSQGFFRFDNLMFVYIPAKRAMLSEPSIEPVRINDKTKIAANVGKYFLSYILGLDYQLYGAKIDNNIKLEQMLNKWFDNFLRALQGIYDCNELKLQRDTKNLSFKIEMPGREPFALHEMSDGYAAFLNIIMELLMRLEEADAVVDYEKSAIVMIDEIETHLHVEMQKRVLPFLTQMFPNVQFIVATHSPFVMTSLENAIVFDLETKERLEKPSFYSYDTVVESFLDTSIYSDELKKYFARYKELCLKDRTPKENEEFLQAKAELEIRAIPSTELYIAFQELENTRRAAKNGTSA